MDMAKQPLLDEGELNEALSGMQGWQVEEGKWLVKKYRFPGFAEAMTFVNRVAEIAESMNHHPFIAIDYRLVTLRLTSWHAGGITRLDIDSIRAYDQASGGSSE